ncbi:MAG TPA: aspartyl protease family protein [Terracidiphilus sp.]|nr:aspartyl protease family protein [Terracidiphilus sp.]
MNLHRLLLTIVLLASVSLGLSAADSKAAGGTATFTLPFELIDNRVFIEVRLNGKGPYHFILDTGAVADIGDHVAQQLGLKPEEAGEGQGVGEKKQHFGRTHIAEVQIGELQLRDVEFGVTSLDDSPQVFGTKPVDGIIGREVFERVVVKHDYIRRILTFTPPEKFTYSGAGSIVHFELPRQIPVVEAELDGVSGKFGVDTGARSAMLLYGPFCAQNQLQEKYGARLEGVTGWGLGGPVRSLLARAKELKIGDVRVRDLVIRLSTQKTGLTTSSAMAGLIGPDVLAQFDVTFDYARSRIIFEKNQSYGRRDSYDRAGVWMGQNGKHFTVVDVIGGGPAQEAGVKQGDTILAIDGKSAETLVLPDVRESMRRRPVGDKVSLLLESEGKQRTAVITLRDLV